MNRLKGYRSFWMLVAVTLVGAMVDPVFAQLSTTGPTPPPGIDRGIRAPTRTQVVIPGVPAYLWHHGCGPTAVGMVVGYWDGNGHPNLVPGDAATQTAAANTMMSGDSENPDCAAPDGDHYQDYCCPRDTPPDLLPDRSETGGAHVSNCVGDFFRTSFSSGNCYYGWSWYGKAPGAFEGYVNWVAPRYNPGATNKVFAEFSWQDYKAEIEAGRPIVLLVDTDGNGITDHFVTGIGYDDVTMEYAIHDTWDTNVHWFSWREIQEGQEWGIYGVTVFRLSAQIPTLTEWGLITCCVLLAWVAWAVVRRKKRAPTRV